MNKKITINDIANLAGVSKTTVSRFLNDKYDGMSEETRLRIEKIITESGYRPNRQARALKAQHSSIIGIVVVDISNPYTSRMVKGIMDRLKNTEYHTLIMDSDINRERELKNVNKLLDEQVDGIILQPLAKHSSDYQIIGNQYPVVQIDRYVEPLLWPAVVSDNFVQSRNLAQLFLDKQYQRVIVVSPPIEYATPRVNRLKGMMNLLADSDIEVKQVITTEIRDIIARDDDLWEQLRDDIRDDIKTVIYTFNGGLLYGIIKLMKEKNILIPEQVGVVGYDDGSWADLVSPGITSIEQNPVAIGYQAADQLLAQINGEKQLVELTCIDSKLNIRYSL
ncbi:LacI family DNA-binding transcriptional regulator [Lactococcus sp. dk322]|nr:LacI family DNA-binding transcriptional regulator [Lactococcus sp. dk322]MQW22997.1 LacI family DNA-binding transcriptional regulator [Lactococcus sp. dk101]TXK44445.1 LacI family DNA-binding transcriptional regulator [Lactococcus sp. dk310]TXK50152.1 LacI family DNA-binding transcriptional regulator [Lactococcus sp. dk322]